MIQDQLVEYISSQMKTGVSRDTIKNTLVAAGWQTADVEDTLKKVESARTSQPMTTSPMATGATAVTTSVASSQVTATKPSGPQTIKMSDLVSTSEPVTSSSSKSFTGSKPMEAMPGATSFSAKGFSEKPASSHGALITEIILGLLVVAIGALAGYLYFENSGLNAKISASDGTSGMATQQLATLQQQINASTTSWTAQIATLSANEQELQAELSFYAAPPATASGATSTATLSGSVSGGGKVPYLISATYGAKVYISNSKDASVAAELAPLVASSTTSTFTGIYLPGADSMMLTAVGGTSVN